MPSTRTGDRPLAPNHQVVFEALKRIGRPATAYELIDAVRPAGISAPPTVYRALARLMEAGLAHRLESLNAFIACTHGPRHEGTVVFAICTVCGNAEELIDKAISRRLSKTTAECGFAADSTIVELRGTCSHCAAERARMEG